MALQSGLHRAESAASLSARPSSSAPRLPALGDCHVTFLLLLVMDELGLCRPLGPERQTPVTQVTCFEKVHLSSAASRVAETNDRRRRSPKPSAFGQALTLIHNEELIFITPVILLFGLSRVIQSLLS